MSQRDAKTSWGSALKFYRIPQECPFGFYETLSIHVVHSNYLTYLASRITDNVPAKKRRNGLVG